MGESTRTYEDTLKEERHVLSQQEDLVREKQKLQEYEEEATQLQGRSLDALSQIEAGPLSRDDRARLDEIIIESQHFGHVLNSRITERFDRIKERSRQLDERLDNLYYERQVLAMKAEETQKEKAHGKDGSRVIDQPS